MPDGHPPTGGAIVGRGISSNRESRYAKTEVSRDDGIETSDPRTECRPETARSIIARNQSPDIPFEQSINPYRGCEHGCSYCYARPTHAWLDLSAGLDFETRLSYKHNAASQLERELRAPAYRCKPITIGANTDPYQPVERQYGITREILQVLQRFRHPLTIITKSALITRDIDILAEMAGDKLCSVAISVTTLDNELKRRLEPRAPSCAARLQTIAKLRERGIPVSVLVAPVIPALNDAEMEAILQRSQEAGAQSANYILLRLPLEVAQLFQEWLAEHYPLRAEHVMSLVRQSRDGQDYETRFGHRMRGTGVFAQLLSRRFEVACKKLELQPREANTYNRSLDNTRFEMPPAAGDQYALF
jgi:DNA repair photolyase